MQLDDIRLYTKSEWDTVSLIHLTGIHSKEIEKSFGLEKYSQIVVNTGKAIKTDRMELPVSHIADIQTNYNTFVSHSYLGTMMRRQRSQQNISTTKGKTDSEQPTHWEE